MLTTFRIYAALFLGLLMCFPCCYGSKSGNPGVCESKKGVGVNTLASYRCLRYRIEDFTFLDWCLEKTPGQPVWKGPDYKNWRTREELKNLVAKDEVKDVLLIDTPWNLSIGEVFRGCPDKQAEKDEAEKLFQFCERLGYKQVIYRAPCWGAWSFPPVWRITANLSHSKDLHTERRKYGSNRARSAAHRMVLCPADDCIEETTN